jgi:hypothetical protein
MVLAHLRPPPRNLLRRLKRCNTRSKFCLYFKVEEEYYYLQEVLLSRHARKLLRTRSLKEFVYFGDVVSRPLRMWLYREKNRDASVSKEELPTLLGTLAHQFEVQRMAPILCYFVLTK